VERTIYAADVRTTYADAHDICGVFRAIYGYRMPPLVPKQADKLRPVRYPYGRMSDGTHSLLARIQDQLGELSLRFLLLILTIVVLTGSILIAMNWDPKTSMTSCTRIEGKWVMNPPGSAEETRQVCTVPQPTPSGATSSQSVRGP
jgi:hypothetical protein